MREETQYERRELLLDELREEMGWEAAVLVRVDGRKGASILSSVRPARSPTTYAVVRALGEWLPGFLSEAYKGAGVEAMDFVDRKGSP